MLMKGYAAKHADDGHAVLLVAPGWVRTEMGGSDALLSIEESIPRVVDMIEANRAARACATSTGSARRFPGDRVPPTRPWRHGRRCSDRRTIMARILITGSANGLGLMAGQHLAREGHEVVLHARSDARDEAACRALPEAAGILIGDVVTIAAMRAVAAQANATGRFDAVIHNVGIGYREPRRIPTADGLSHLFAINVLTPYLLTALIERPDRRVYLSSGMHPGGPDMDDLQWERRRWNGSQAYAESKFLDVALAFGVARRWRTCGRTRSSRDGSRRGWAVRAHRTTWPRLNYPGLAGRERRAPRPLDGTLLLPPGAARAGPAHAGRGVPGRASGCLRAADGRPLTAMTIGLGSTDATDRTGPQRTYLGRAGIRVVPQRDFFQRRASHASDMLAYSPVGVPGAPPPLRRTRFER